MNVTDFTYLIKNPSKVVDPLQTKQLEDILEEYPYFQAARALHLKGLKNLNSYKYNKALKTTAAFTLDRDVLFDFITSKDFLQSKQGVNTIIIEEEVLKVEDIKDDIKHIIENSEDKPLPQDKEDANTILDPKLFTSKYPNKTESEDLQLGQPLEFDKKEKFSFNQWLQLASKQPIVNEKDTIESNEENKDLIIEQNPEQLQNFERIDKFIAKNPKIVPNKNTPIPQNIANSGILDKNELMTETLARVYLEQKKYKNAIQAYKILSLKYPEKSGFFADRIKIVEKIQLENR
jgi:hypothetical protein